jgi:hypothetical protein
MARLVLAFCLTAAPIVQPGAQTLKIDVIAPAGEVHIAQEIANVRSQIEREFAQLKRVRDEIDNRTQQPRDGAAIDMRVLIAYQLLEAMQHILLVRPTQSTTLIGAVLDTLPNGRQVELWNISEWLRRGRPLDDPSMHGIVFAVLLEAEMIQKSGSEFVVDGVRYVAYQDANDGISFARARR